MVKLRFVLIINENELLFYFKNKKITVNLLKYGFDYTKPIEIGSNHFYNNELIDYLKIELKKEFSFFRLFLSGIKIYVGTAQIDNLVIANLLIDFSQSLTKADTEVELYENVKNVDNIDSFFDSIKNKQYNIVAKITTNRKKFYKDLN